MPLIRTTLVLLAALVLLPTLAGCDDDDDPVLPEVDDESVVGVITERADLQTLEDALEAAGLIEALQANGPFTVFAPTNSAFAGLGAGTIQALLARDPDTDDLINLDILQELLRYHVVQGEI
ncbi:MAG: fasciclin domain-containing protein, partial [Rhodothermales bacterium]|nr:fasciclin domain-containing protein [Rhodothermales bacterium]